MPKRKKKADTHFDMLSRRGRRGRRIIVSLIFVFAITVGVLFYYASITLAPPPGIGRLGSSHEHALLRIVIDEEPINFGLPKYQLRSDYVHFEGGDSKTIHKHASGVTLGFLLRTLGMKLDDATLILDDDRVLRTQGDKVLKFFVNGSPYPTLATYDIQEGDRTLVYYGDANEDQIEKQLGVLEQ